MLVLLVLVGTTGVGAAELTTGTVDKLTNGYGPADDANSSALALMLDSETALRGYLLSPNQSFLQPYQRSHARVLPTLDAVGKSLAKIGDHSHDAQITTQRDLANQWLTGFAAAVATSPGSAAKVTAIQQQQAKQLFDQFRLANIAVGASLGSKRDDLRSESRRLRAFTLPATVALAVLSVALALLLGLRISEGISRPLGALASVVDRLDRGDLSARAETAEGPVEVRTLASAVNALRSRAQGDIQLEREAEQLRRQTRLVSALTRRMPDPGRMTETLVRGLSKAYEADRVWLHTFQDERVPKMTVQWQRSPLSPLPDVIEREADLSRGLADRMWDGAEVTVIDNHSTYTSGPNAMPLMKAARDAGISASIVAPIGDGTSTFGVLWVAMVDHPRTWTATESGVAQHLAADVAHGLIQAHVIARQRDAVEQLRQLDQAKADFISNVSHELRTPLTSITGYVEMLQDGDGGALPEQADQMLAIVNRNATRLRNLIEDLLTQSRIDAGRLQLSVVRVDLASILHGVRSAMLPIAAAAGVAFELHIGRPTDLSVDGDAQQLEQVFTNLISNAIKFTPNGGNVSVTTDRDDEGLAVHVADSGIGIPQEELSKLFGRFFRASNAAMAALPGTGLGLAIVKEIVQRHGGDVAVDSVINEGSTFTVWLPLHLVEELM